MRGPCHSVADPGWVESGALLDPGWMMAASGLFAQVTALSWTFRFNV